MALPRLCTWPLPRPALGQPSSATPALPALRGCCQHKLPEQPEPVGREQNFQLRPGSSWGHHQGLVQGLAGPRGWLLAQVRCLGTCPCLQPPPGPSQGRHKRSSSLRNASGNLSYAHLITKSIKSSGWKQLMLSQI